MALAVPQNRPGTITAAPAGGVGGQSFDDATALQAHQLNVPDSTLRLIEQRGYAGSLVTRLTATYSPDIQLTWGENPYHQGNAQVVGEVPVGHVLTALWGRWTSSHIRNGCVSELHCETRALAELEAAQGAGPGVATAPRSPGQHALPAKHNNTQVPFTFRAPLGFRIAALHGRYGHYLDGLGVVFAAAVPRQWTPEAHPYFPRDFRAGVRALLLSYQRMQQEQQQGRAGLPPDVWYLICQRLNDASYHSFARLEDAGFRPIQWVLREGQPPVPAATAALTAQEVFGLNV